MTAVMRAAVADRSPYRELVRCLGAAVLSPPPSGNRVVDALGLPPMTREAHTEAFVVQAPPHAAIHLGAEGKLGGETVDRIQGFWRAVGITPPDEPDHLGVLLMGYAALSDLGGDPAAHAARVLLHEHVWAWAPGYLTALREAVPGPIEGWAGLTAQALAHEVEAVGLMDGLPVALASAVPPVPVDPGREELLDAMVAPLRSGVVLTRRAIDSAAQRLGLGLRRGERRYALRGMLDQDARRTLGWYAELAERTAGTALAVYGDNETGRWWRQRAAATATAVSHLVGVPA